MQDYRTPGSARGPSGNRRSYLDYNRAVALKEVEDFQHALLLDAFPVSNYVILFFYGFCNRLLCDVLFLCATFVTVSTGTLCDMVINEAEIPTAPRPR